MLTGKLANSLASTSWITEAVEFANKNFDIGFGGIGAWHLVSLKEIKNIPDCIKAKRKEIIEQNNFESWEDNLEICDHIVFVDDKADLEAHTDDLSLPEFKNFQHIRASWIVQTPMDGGKIIANDVEFKTELNDVCVIDALKPHRVTKVVGKIPLILYTFGFIKEKNYA